MDVKLLLTLISSAVMAIAGWFVVHQLSLRRERTAKRRDLRVQYLIDAWRKLANAANRTDNSRTNDIEGAIADIQLFGSAKQIDLAQKFATEFAKKGGALLDELLEELRDDLRNELKLGSIAVNIKSLRIINGLNNENTKKR